MRTGGGVSHMKKLSYVRCGRQGIELRAARCEIINTYLRGA